jgi:hypothetical protein
MRGRERDGGVGPCSSSPFPLPCVHVYVSSYVRLFFVFVCSRVRPLLSLSRGALDTPFYRRKEMPSCTMGCSWELTWLAGKCPELCTDNNVAVGGASRVL